MATGQGTGMGSDGCNKLCSAANGASLACLCQLGLFDTMDGSHVTDLIIPSTYLLMGAGRPVLFVSWFPALSVLTAWRRR